jgi:hypothetical protein
VALQALQVLQQVLAEMVFQAVAEVFIAVMLFLRQAV